MKVLIKEKARALAEKNGWSVERAEGFIDGETSRSRGKPPSAYARVGIDDYCLGFRAGYYEREDSSPGKPAGELAVRRAPMTGPQAPHEGLESLAIAARAG